MWRDAKRGLYLGLQGSVLPRLSARLELCNKSTGEVCPRAAVATVAWHTRPPPHLTLQLCSSPLDTGQGWRGQERPLPSPRSSLGALPCASRDLGAFYSMVFALSFLPTSYYCLLSLSGELAGFFFVCLVGFFTMRGRGRKRISKFLYRVWKRYLEKEQKQGRWGTSFIRLECLGSGSKHHPT